MLSCKPRLCWKWTFCRYAWWWLDGYHRRKGRSILPKQLMDDYERYPRLYYRCAMPTSHDEVSAYGVIAPQGEGKTAFTSLKPSLKTSARGCPSDLAIIGRYLLTPEIFQTPRKLSSRWWNEIQLTEMQSIPHKTQMGYCREFKVPVTMSETSLAENSIDYAQTPQVKDDLKDYQPPRKRVTRGIEE